jgi:hypothetical protein
MHILRDVVDAPTEGALSRRLHRDIEPATVLLTGAHALVMDVGVAKG